MDYNISPDKIKQAHKRISAHINQTPLLESSHLNDWLGHEIIFKYEAFQKTGAFKIRGALNTVLSLQEEQKMPEKLVAFSSGNHAQAVAKVGSMFGIDTTIFMMSSVSKIKVQATKSYGAEVVLTKTRAEAEQLTAQDEKKGSFLVHPFDSPTVIAGQGTACFEALSEVDKKPDAIFAPCGGGGLLSGSYLAKELLSPQTKIFGGEPKNGNDALRSYNSGEIFKFPDTPKTIADGAATMSVAKRTFHYLKKLDGFYDASEDEIIYWTRWLSHLLKTTVEPTSAVAFVAASKWLQNQTSKKRVMIILSGGNIAPSTYKKIWESEELSR